VNPTDQLPSELKESKAARLGRLAHLNVLIAADRDRDAIEERCRVEGITMAQYIALWVLCLADAPDGIPTSALADGLITRQPDVTRLVDRLVKADLAERRASENDRRVVLVKATEKGRATFAALHPSISEYHEQQWSHLTPAELRQLHELLAKALWGSE
jgi:DNA-binding MarR family transcriptional regulator